MKNNLGDGKLSITPAFVEKAEALIPELYQHIVYPQAAITVEEDTQTFQGWSTRFSHRIEEIEKKHLGKDDQLILDFGNHHVGYLHLSIQSEGSPQDAPLRLKLIFGEMPCEVAQDFSQYDGWLSKSWLQEEIIHVDVLPAQIKLPRRYSFRYLKLMVIDTSLKYKVSFHDIYCTAVSSADISKVTALPENTAEALVTIDNISIKTLQDCMHTVFEDGPKRDRRLWIGDLRLQALANYYTSQNNDLVKRCLYLFAGLRLGDGIVGACLFEKPQPLVDDTILYDYSLLFVATLYDYYIETEDRATLIELWPVAWQQIVIGLARVDHRGIVQDDSSWWCFIDWNEDLNKQAAAQAVLIYSLKRAHYLAQDLGEAEIAAKIEEQIELLTQAALTSLWSIEKGFFHSGQEQQISWASQIWMVLAEVFEPEQNAALMSRLFTENPDIQIRTPYMHHHLMEALILCGQKEKALEHLHAYWGKMVKGGADCFFEVYDKEDDFLSPYGSHLINSYCHAWSCTPTYFIRKYFIDTNLYRLF